MTVDYKEYRRKRLLQEMKTCKAYMKKIASGFLELSDYDAEHRAYMVNNSCRVLDEWIEEEQKKQDMGA